QPQRPLHARGLARTGLIRASRARSGGRVRLVLAILIYVAVGVFIYRAWWSARAGTWADLHGDPAAIEARIRHVHYTWLGLQYYARRDFRNAEVAFRRSTRY